VRAREALRVAYFTDCYEEVNGVAVTSRALVDFARRSGRPFFVVHAGHTAGARASGSVRESLVTRGPASIRLERDLGFDPLLWRFWPPVSRELAAFGPDVVHVTGPGDIGALGAALARHLDVPLVAAWHTNLHDYAKTRLERRLAAWPEGVQRTVPPISRRWAMRWLMRFYARADVLVAPTREDVEELRARLGRPALVMGRGVDLERFDPARRSRGDGPLRLGFVGRLSPEKNLRLLAHLERELRNAGAPRFRIVLIGEGDERGWLERNLVTAEFTGVLRGDELARTVADLDLFVFPSRTDTFGVAVLEAQAAGVPAVVTSEGGPKHIVVSGETGLVAETDEAFVAAAVDLVRDPERRRTMGREARRVASTCSWSRAFRPLWDAYALACASRSGTGLTAAG